jgi:transposase
MRVALRSRIVLLAAEGKQHKQISEELKISPRMAALWRRRFLQQGVEGLLKDAPRPGRTPSIPAATVNAVIKKTTQTTPANRTHWSTRTMAREVGVSEASVRRIWHAHGLKPHLVKTFKISRDPEFASKLEAIVGLYLNPPEHALVLCVDEKSQIQALDRTQPGLPLKKGRGQTMTHDYKRNGTATLFAALDTLNGEVFGLCQERHRHQEWLKFLRLIDQTIPQEKHIYFICDNYATHKHEKVIRWLDRHKRFHVLLHPNLGQLAQYGRTLLPRPDREPTAPRHLQKPRTTHHGHRQLHRPTQPESKTLHLDRKSFRHSRKSHPRSSLTR